MFTEDFAAHMDSIDPLHDLRQDFSIPLNRQLPDTDEGLVRGEDECVYFCGNSLGLQPKRTRVLVDEELEKWAARGVIGHFDDSPRPWVSIDEHVTSASAKIVGAQPDEVAIMNTLTVNLHLLLVCILPVDPTVLCSRACASV